MSSFRLRIPGGVAFVILCLSVVASAQTSSFSYQGRLTDGGSPANGAYDLQFTLWDDPAAGNQVPVGSPVTATRSGVPVSAGIFTVLLDFTTAAFPGADRYLEISVKHPADTSYTTLSPRQQLASAPYAIRSANSASADTATNATQLGGVAANQFVQTADSRLSDARTPTAGSTNYIQNGTAQQASSNFNISGDGVAAGTLTGNVVSATSRYNIGANRVLALGTQSTYVGVNAGAAITTGTQNSFLGISAGQNNTSGSSNTFIGANSGLSNSTEGGNTFIGSNANAVGGVTNATAIGVNASVTTSNGFVLGTSSTKVGIGTTAPNFKLHIVDSNFPSIRVDGSNPTGAWLQLNNTSTGGHNWGILSSGAGNGEGAGNLVIIDETGGGIVDIDDPLKVDGTITATNAVTATQYNIGANRVVGISGTNTYLGAAAGNSNGGGANTFLGNSAGQSNTSGGSNTFVGTSAGIQNTTGGNNVIVGKSSGTANNGDNNTFVGDSAGSGNSSGDQNVFVGAGSGASNTTENANTFLGYKANGSSGITNATAIGSNAKITRSNAVVIGSLTDSGGNPTDTFVGIGTTNPLTKLHVIENDSSIFRTLRLESSSTTGNWLELVNNSTGAHTWALISAGTSNGEGAGNLVFTDETGGGKVVMNSTLQVPNCSGCTNAPSDRNLKTNFAAVDGGFVLQKLSNIPIQTWSYRDSAGVRHLGPMAQDFFKAFSVGTDDKHINLLDEAGISLAASQELYRRQTAYERQIEALKSANAGLQAANEEMMKRLAALEEQVRKLANK